MNKNNGTGWRYRCKSCGFEVGMDKAFPETCPGCHARKWWGQLTPAIAQNMDGVKRAGIGIKNSEVTMTEGIITPKTFLSQENNAVVCHQRQNKGVYEPSTGQVRGRPRQIVPDDIILELSKKGISSRAIVEELATRGYPGKGYKTIQRRLKALSLDNGVSVGLRGPTETINTRTQASEAFRDGDT